MAYSKDLFDLIKSLSKGEKRYFKLYADVQAGEKQYIKIFDYIDKAEVYDEEQLLKDFKGEAFTKKFHVMKNYLANMILKSTRAIDAKTVERKIQNGITDAGFLKDKGLYAQQKKILELTLKTAQKYDQKIYQLEILSELRKNSIEFTNRGLTEHSLELSNSVLEVMRQLEQERLLDHIYDQVFILFRKQRIARTASQVEVLEELVLPVKTLDNIAAIPFRGQCRYHSIMAVYNRLIQNPESFYKHLKESIHLWEGHTHMIEAYQYDYKLTLSNYLSACYSIGEFNDFEYYLDKIEALPCSSFNEEAEQFQNVTFYRLLYLANTGKVEQAKALVPYIEQGLLDYEIKINEARKLAITYTVASFYFVCGDYKKSLDWCTKITSGKSSDPRKDIQHFARMMELIIHYELGNYQFLSNLLSTTYKSLKKQQALYDYESIIIRYLKKIPFTPNKKEQALFFQYFQADIKKFELENPEQKPLGIKELNIWLEAKTTNNDIQNQYLKTITPSKELA